ncbi:unnamed protein product [Cylindrotheca closterium]|uniref:Uncharacterized protein n=1 Tax=Cylindrotheca closterium TaxID=2856 RepID=A0AAD2FI35_9STRA|nr:unnamed protein product [Cylindrotheca closterium]
MAKKKIPLTEQEQKERQAVYRRRNREKQKALEAGEDVTIRSLADLSHMSPAQKKAYFKRKNCEYQQKWRDKKRAEREALKAAAKQAKSDNEGTEDNESIISDFCEDDNSASVASIASADGKVTSSPSAGRSRYPREAKRKSPIAEVITLDSDGSSSSTESKKGAWKVEGEESLPIEQGIAAKKQQRTPVPVKKEQQSSVKKEQSAEDTSNSRGEKRDSSHALDFTDGKDLPACKKRASSNQPSGVKLSPEGAKLEQENEQLQDEVKQLKALNGRLQARVNELEGKGDSLEEAGPTLCQDCAHVNRQNAELHGWINDLETRQAPIQHLEAEIDVLKDQMRTIHAMSGSTLIGEENSI